MIWIKNISGRDLEPIDWLCFYRNWKLLDKWIIKKWETVQAYNDYYTSFPANLRLVDKPQPRYIHPIFLSVLSFILWIVWTLIAQALTK